MNVQGPIKKQQPDGMSRRGVGGGLGLSATRSGWWRGHKQGAGQPHNSQMASKGVHVHHKASICKSHGQAPDCATRLSVQGPCTTRDVLFWPRLLVSACRLNEAAHCQGAICHTTSGPCRDTHSPCTCITDPQRRGVHCASRVRSGTMLHPLAAALPVEEYGKTRKEVTDLLVGLKGYDPTFGLVTQAGQHWSLATEVPHQVSQS